MSALEPKNLERKLRNAAPDLKAGEAEGEAVDAGPGNPRIAGRASAFETRAQSITSQARAAGATRLDNEADLLGFSVPKRKSASRAILG